jgi:hypothetical protein
MSTPEAINAKLEDKVIEQIVRTLNLTDTKSSRQTRIVRYGNCEHLLIMDGKNTNGETEKWVIKYSPNLKPNKDVLRNIYLYYNSDITPWIGKLIPEGRIGILHYNDEADKANNQIVSWVATRHVGVNFQGLFTMQEQPNSKITHYTLAFVNKKHEETLKLVLEEYFDKNAFDSHNGYSLEDTICGKKGKDLAAYLYERLNKATLCLEDNLQGNLTKGQKNKHLELIEDITKCFKDIATKVKPDEDVKLMFVPPDLYTHNITLKPCGNKYHVYYIDQALRSEASHIYSPPEELVWLLTEKNKRKFEPLPQAIVNKIREVLFDLNASKDSEYKFTGHRRLVNQVLNLAYSAQELQRNVRKVKEGDLDDYF